jgi:DNA adenine methylase
MNGGPIGGIRQGGKWKLSARFNKRELLARCARVAEYRDRIALSARDGLEYIRTADADSAMLFIDPPYFTKGPSLYLNALSARDHAAIADQLKLMQDAAWVLTYDDCPEVRQLYAGWARLRPYSLRYVAAERRAGDELLITPNWLVMPTL